MGHLSSATTDIDLSMFVNIKNYTLGMKAQYFVMFNRIEKYMSTQAPSKLPEILFAIAINVSHKIHF